MNRFLSSTLYPLAVVAGWLAIAGASVAAARHHPVALAVCALIAAFFALGLIELRRGRAATRALQALLAAPPAADGLAAWLDRAPATLQDALRQRLAGGARAALPVAALAPALTGLLVLLGMLGTFVGLVLTLGGTANALAATADLASLRAALGAPVQGLGLAFSCSVAGVAASAALGLLVALARRERAAVTAQLDGALLVDGALWPFTAACRREQTQQQALAAERAAAAAAQAALVDRLAGFASELGERLAAQQQQFHAQAERSYQGLAAAVDSTLRTSLTESARLAGSTIQPAAEAVMAGIAREAASLHQRVGEQVSSQLAAVGDRVEAGLSGLHARSEQLLQRVAEQAVQAHQAQQQTAAQLAERLALQSQAWIEQLQAAQQREQAARAADRAARHATDAADREQAQALRAAERAQDAERHAAWLQAQADQQAAHQQQLAQLLAQTEASARTLSDRLGAQTAALLAQAEAAQQRWREAEAASQAAQDAARREQQQWLAEQRALAQQLLADGQARSAAEAGALAERFAAQTATWLAQLEQAQAAQRQALSEAQTAQLGAWQAGLQQAASVQQAQHQQLAAELAQAVGQLVAQAEAQSRATIAEASTLLQAAGEAPRAAVEVVAALREQLSQSLAQDQATLAERAQLMQTLHTLLNSLQQAAGEQRAAIDALVQGAAGQLAEVGAQFVAQAQATGTQLGDAAGQLAGSAAELGALGEGFAAAVDGFQAANAQLLTHLSGLETQLAGAMARSDEQLGYYVGQARELIELCVGSQKQVLDELRGLKAGEAIAHG